MRRTPCATRVADHRRTGGLLFLPPIVATAFAVLFLQFRLPGRRLLFNALDRCAGWAGDFDTHFTLTD